jgi:hypothetical protein
MIAAIGSLDQVGVLKLVSSISYYITEIIKKTFGTASFTLFSHNRDSEHSHKQHIFGVITRPLFYTLTIICILFIWHHRQCVSFFSPECHYADWTAAYIFLIIHFSEYFLLTYKKFFIAHESVHQINILKCIDIALIIFSLKFIPTPYLIASIFISRALIISSFMIYSYYFWHIHPFSTSKK